MKFILDNNVLHVHVHIATGIVSMSDIKNKNKDERTLQMFAIFRDSFTRS